MTNNKETHKQTDKTAHTTDRTDRTIPSVTISASMMCANWMHLEQDIRELEQNQIDFLHYDIMDGFFVEDYCLGTNIIREINRHTHLPSDYHLMVEDPIRILKNFTPRSERDRLIIHYEACRHFHRDIIRVKQQGFRAGIAINPATTLEAIDYVIEEVDAVMIMTVNPGYKGQKLVPQMIPKIAKCAELKRQRGLSFDIVVDGNVNPSTVPDMVASGATGLVGGSSGLFRSDMGISQAISLLREAVK